MMRLLPRSLPFALLLTASACGATLPQEKSTVNGKDSAAIIKRIGLILPPSTVIEHSDYTAGMDDAARVRMVMSETDWRGFLRAIVERVPHPPEFSGESNYSLGPPVQGWNLAEAAGLKTAEVEWGGNKAEGLAIGYAPAGAGKVRVFLFWHQT